MIKALYLFCYDDAMFMINGKLSYLDYSYKEKIALAAIIQTGNRHLIDIESARKYLYEYLQKHLDKINEGGQERVLERILFDNRRGYLKYLVRFLPVVSKKIFVLFFLHGFSRKEILQQLRKTNRYILIRKSATDTFTWLTYVE